MNRSVNRPDRLARLAANRTTNHIPFSLTHLAASTAILLTLIAPPASADNLVPGRAWPRWNPAEDAGFSSTRIAEAESRWYNLADPSNAAFFLVYQGKVLASFGDESYPFWCHSVRKSFLSALYGVQVEQGRIDLESTMAQLGIEDVPPLTAAEQEARVVDLLRSRSGVYLEAACETQEARDARPQRGSHPPGTFFYYNNWDFNALGTIFRQETGLDVFEEFERGIASLVRMQDFRASDCEYDYEYQYSTHPCYKFRMSARDRARFGQLFLQRGRWGRRQVVPEAWVEESTRVHTAEIGAAEGLPGWGYGYMWHVQSPEFFQVFFVDPRLHWLRAFSASGYGGQVIMVFPEADMVLVLAADVYAGVFLEMGEVAPIFELIISEGPLVEAGNGQSNSDNSTGTENLGPIDIGCFSETDAMRHRITEPGEGHAGC